MPAEDEWRSRLDASAVVRLSAGGLQVARHFRIGENTLDRARLLEARVMGEAEPGEDAQLDLARKLPLHEPGRALQRGHHRPRLAADEGRDIGGRGLQIRADAHLGHGHRSAGEIGIVQPAGGEDSHQRVADLLADAKLAL